MATRIAHFRKQAENGIIPPDLTPETLLEFITLVEEFRDATAGCNISCKQTQLVEALEHYRRLEEPSSYPEE